MNFTKNFPKSLMDRIQEGFTSKETEEKLGNLLCLLNLFTTTTKVIRLVEGKVRTRRKTHVRL